jgi:hypothetical protein
MYSLLIKGYFCPNYSVYNFSQYFRPVINLTLILPCAGQVMNEYIFSGMSATVTEKGPLAVRLMKYVTTALCDIVGRSYKLSKRD